EVALRDQASVGGDGADEIRPAIVAEHVHAVERGYRLPAVHVAADDRAVAIGVTRLEHRIADAVRCRAAERVQALARAPSPIDSLFAVACEVDLLVLVLAHVADPQVAGLAIERETPRIPQAPHPGLGADTGPSDEGIVGRDRVRGTSPRRGIHAQNLRQERREVLADVIGIALAAAVTESDVEHPVRTRDDLPTFVIRVRL